MARPLRLFFALWPEPAVQRKLAALARDVRRSCGGKPTRTENLHLTLLFLGEVAEEAVAGVRSAADEVHLPAFELRLCDFGYWAQKGIAWIAPVAPPRVLFDLVAGLSDRLAARGFRFDDRPYVPHLTLLRHARCRDVSWPTADILWTVREFVLVSSTLREDGAAYETIGTWPLPPVPA